MNKWYQDQAITMEHICKVAAKKIAMKRNDTHLFVLNEEETKYDVSNPNTTRLYLAIRNFWVGLSFCQTAVLMQNTKDVRKLPRLTSIKYHLFGEYVRVLVASNLLLIY